MATDWNATVIAVQAALDGTTNGPLTQAELNAGVTVREALKTAGAAYDAGSNDGPLNTTPYALSVQSWAATAQPAWVEVDRVARAIYQVVGSPSQYARAAFGVSGVQPWTASTDYTVRTGVTPKTPNGYSYFGSSGTSGATEPSWPLVIGQTTTDGSGIWVCCAAVSGGSAPAVLPWDVTLQTVLTLTTRYSAAITLATGPINGGLQGLMSSTFSTWSAALAAKPAADPIADATSLSVNAALSSAIASANAWIAVTAFH